MPPSTLESLYQATYAHNVSCRTGTPYACSEKDIDNTYHWTQDNRRPLVSAVEANREVMEHNDPTKQMSSHERDAVRRLYFAMSRAGSVYEYWGPDLIIKCFLDLDTVLFGGVLRGNVGVDWDTNNHAVRADQLGVTRKPCPGRADIFLNAKAILVDHARPLEAMFTVILHEMCHAFVFVRVRSDEVPSGEGHDEHFRTMIRAVYRRAKDAFYLEVIENAGGSTTLDELQTGGEESDDESLEYDSGDEEGSDAGDLEA